MSLVVLIEDVEAFQSTSFIEEAMRRWGRQGCKRHIAGGEIYFEVATPKKFNLHDGIKHLASFGVKARIARRPIP